MTKRGLIALGVLALGLMIASLIIARSAQAHMLRCNPWGKMTAAKHRCHVKQVKHATFALRWARSHPKTQGASTVKKNHRWLIRQMHHRIKRWHSRRQAQPSGNMITTTATWYGPGFYGNRTACGQTLTQGSWWVASMVHGCGTKLTICAGSKCARTTVQDTGAFTPGHFDLAPGVASYLGGYYTRKVRWRLGW